MNPPIAIALINAGIAFVLAFGMILIVTVVARYIASAFASERASRIAGFCVAIGYALGHFSEGSASTVRELAQVSTPIGAFAGLVAAWAWLIRSSASGVTETDA